MEAIQPREAGPVGSGYCPGATTQRSDSAQGKSGTDRKVHATSRVDRTRLRI